MTTKTRALALYHALAVQDSHNDPTIKATYKKFQSPKGHGLCQGYLVVPTDLQKRVGTVLVVHENRGLNPYIKSVVRRVARQGFIAFAPDALYPLGGYPGHDDDGRFLQRSLNRDKLKEDFIAAAQCVHQDVRGNGKLGAVGFCFGGHMVNMLAALLPEQVAAAVAFYGEPPEKSLRDKVKGPLMLQFAGLDDRINHSWPAYKKALQENDANYVDYWYAGVHHGFHNDSTARYAKVAADLAWARTMAFFQKHLES